MKKISKYVNFISYEGAVFLYNLANSQIIALKSELIDIIHENRELIDNLSTIHPELYRVLSEHRIITDCATNEEAELIERFKCQDSDPSSFSIIINPTLDCNLQCWYCYETHRKGSLMQPGVIASIKQLINNKLANDCINRLSVSFFGGEPLIGWNRVVLPILEFSKERNYSAKG